MYILAPNQVAKTYPYSLGKLRRDNPNTSFSSRPSDTTLAEWGVFPVQPTEYPEVDYTKNVHEGTPVLHNGVWVQVWVVTEAPPEEIEERKARQLQNLRSKRASAYAAEADPLFFKAQRGEATLDEWSAKVQEIRERVPYPEE